MAPKKQERDSDTSSHPNLQKLQDIMMDKEFQWSVESSLRNHIQLLEKSIYQTQVEISYAETEYNLNRAAELKYARLSILEEHLKIINLELEKIQKLERWLVNTD
jgi:ATP-dependent Clp protease ATP-binding subunit ClpB